MSIAAICYRPVNMVALIQTETFRKRARIISIWMEPDTTAREGRVTASV